MAGHAAVCWKIDHFKNQIEGFVYADSCAIVAAPGTVIEQSCSWKPVTKTRIQKGCEELRASLKVVREVARAQIRDEGSWNVTLPLAFSRHGDVPFAVYPSTGGQTAKGTSVVPAKGAGTHEEL